MAEKIPVMKVQDNLLVSIQVDMTDEMAIQLQQDILSRIVETGARGVLIDISALDMVDSFLARGFSETARMAAIMDAVVVIVGMQPAIALTLVELGLDLKDVHTALNVDSGVELLESIKRKSEA
jgi:rsbT antagonist protein RsbS